VSALQQLTERIAISEPTDPLPVCVSSPGILLSTRFPPQVVCQRVSNCNTVKVVKLK
jgi:hypothetical protein